MRNTKAIILFTQEVLLSRGNPSEPYAAIAWEDIDLLFSAMLTDLVDQISKLQLVDIFLSVDSVEIDNESLLSFQRKVNVFDHSSLSLPQRIGSALHNLFENGYHRLILGIHHYPLLGTGLFNSVFNQLNYEEDCIVLSKNSNDDISLIGLKSNYENWFELKPDLSVDKSNVSSLDYDYILQKACLQDIMIFNTPNITAINNGFDLEKLKRCIEQTMNTQDYFAKHTYEIFKYIDKKYFNRKRKDEDWDIRRHI
jgi:hypothetical protein